MRSSVRTRSPNFRSPLRPKRVRDGPAGRGITLTDFGRKKHISLKIKLMGGRAQTADGGSGREKVLKAQTRKVHVRCSLFLCDAQFVDGL